MTVRAIAGPVVSLDEQPWITIKGGAMDGLVIRMTPKGLAELERLEAAAQADPTIKEPTDDPDDDIEAEVPDVKEDEVPE